MKMESISDCLNFIDTMILSGIEKHVCIGTLKDLRDCITRMHKKIYRRDGICVGYTISN